MKARATAGSASAPKTRKPRAAASARHSVTRVQTGLRMERRVLLVLKALAGSLDLSLGDLLEGIVLHAFEGKAPFGKETLAKVQALKEVYGLDLTAGDSHRLTEAKPETRKG